MNRVYKKDCESYCEYTLPDYMGDVKKILSVNASAIPSGKFVGDGEVEYSGVVTYDVLYSDAEGKLTRLTASSDYDLTLPTDTSTYIDSLAEPQIANLSTRLTGPRKLIAKAVVSNRITASYEDAIETVGTAFAEGNTPEVAKKSVRLENLTYVSSPEREYAEEAERLTATMPDQIEIIATSGAVRVYESTPVENGVNVKGEIVITSIIRTDEQPPFAIKKNIPFDETVTFENIESDMQTLFDGYLTSVTTGLAEDGEDTVVTVNAIAELVGIAGKNKDVEIITDAYLKDADTDASYEDYSYSELVAMSAVEETVSLSIPRADVGCEYIRNILTMSADVRSLERRATQNGIELSGDIALCGAACEINDDNNESYVPVKLTAPFSVLLKTAVELPADAEIEARAAVVDVDCGIDPDVISAKCTLKIGYRVTKCASVRRMTECNSIIGTEHSERPHCITVYYPEDGESLFDIAKKFHTTGAKIAADNKLAEPTLSAMNSPDSVIGVKKLIIR